MTKPFRKAAVSFLLLAGAACGPLPVYYQPGAEVSRLDSDTLSCQTHALQQAPVANEIRQNPPVFYPGRQYCSGGNCYYRPGYWVDGGIYTVDVNKGLRSRVEQACMAGKGYQQIGLKRCTRTGPQTAVPPRLPALDETACAVRTRDGKTRIVTAP